MNRKKYFEAIHYKYLPKVQYAIDILRSCKTKGQVEACADWFGSLCKSWARFECGQIKGYGAWNDLVLCINVGRKIDNLADYFNSALDEKVKQFC